jgi:polyphosphate kinase 2 (PPK2 family)
MLLKSIQAQLAEQTTDPVEASPRPEDQAPESDSPEAPTARLHDEQPKILSLLDLSKQLSKADYRRLLPAYQGRLNELQKKARDRGVSTLIVFEGWDASGKGGAIRRINAALDSRAVRVIPVAAPTDEESAHHYLWRFWRHLSRAGQFTIFDRSWYGRVLVERVEGFATEKDWRRAYTEINQFEQQMVDHGIVVLKFWMHIGNDEQLRRFEVRQQTSYKRWKLTDEDWRNRERWPEYELAVHDMVERTSTSGAPWRLVEGNDKRFARVSVLRQTCEALAAALEEPVGVDESGGAEAVAEGGDGSKSGKGGRSGKTGKKGKNGKNPKRPASRPDKPGCKKSA